LLLTPSSIDRALRTFSGTQKVSNFSPVQAASIYHEYLPEQGGIVFDPSCGWGGRLLGAISCKRVHKYIGCDPGTETFKGLERMRDELLPMAQKMGRSLEVELHMLGSETKEIRAALEPNSVHLVFSSPAYFLQERYSDDPAQSWKKYPDQESWLNGFMGATLDNCAYCLKPGGVLAINIASVSSYKGSLEDDFLLLASRKGFASVGRLQLELSAMPGAKHKYGKHKPEPIFVFKRHSPMPNSRNLVDSDESAIIYTHARSLPTLARKQIIEEHFDAADWQDDWSPRYNIAPTQQVPVVRRASQRTDPPACSDEMGTCSIVVKRYFWCGEYDQRSFGDSRHETSFP
jgi:hypothetical protein